MNKAIVNFYSIAYTLTPKLSLLYHILHSTLNSAVCSMLSLLRRLLAFLSCLSLFPSQGFAMIVQRSWPLRLNAVSLNACMVSRCSISKSLASVSSTITVNDIFSFVDALVVNRSWWRWDRRRWGQGFHWKSFSLFSLPLDLSNSFATLALDVFRNLNEAENILLCNC